MMVFAAQPRDGGSEAGFLSTAADPPSLLPLLRHHCLTLLSIHSSPTHPPIHPRPPSICSARKCSKLEQWKQAADGWEALAVGTSLLQTFFAPALVMLPGRLPTVGPIYLICALELQELCFDSCSEERRCRK